MKNILSAIKEIDKSHHSIAILLPGFLDSNRYVKMEVFANELNKIGYATLRLDPCGLWYGEGTDETYTATGYLADIESALQEMLAEIPDPKNVLLLGHSMGGYLAIVAATKLGEVTHVCSLCPPDSLKRLAERGDWKETGIKKSSRRVQSNSTEIRNFVLPYSCALDMLKYEAMDVIGNVKARLMIGISMNDESVRIEATERLAGAANNPYIARFEGMDHHFGHDVQKTEKVWEYVKKFLQK